MRQIQYLVPTSRDHLSPVPPLQDELFSLHELLDVEFAESLHRFAAHDFRSGCRARARIRETQGSFAIAEQPVSSIFSTNEAARHDSPAPSTVRDQDHPWETYYRPATTKYGRRLLCQRRCFYWNFSLSAPLRRS